MAEGGMIEVQDSVLWPMNLKGAPKLRAQLLAMGPEEIVSLKVNGQLTVWERMRDGKDGRPMQGLKPCGAQTRALWQALYRDRKGDLVTVAEDK